MSPQDWAHKFLELAAKGVEVVKGDFDQPNSIQHAFAGVYGAFVVTDCMCPLGIISKPTIRSVLVWGNYMSILKQSAQGIDPGPAAAEQEIQQGKILVDAAKAAGVKHFIFS